MNKKLTTKVQKLNPALSEKTTNLSGCFALEPETRDVILKKGVLYCVFNIKTEAEFDTVFAINIVSDVLREKYFQSTGSSPIQSLEKSVSEVKNKITQLLSVNGLQDMNILAGVLWGSVFYIVKMGQGEVLLAREGDLRAVNMLTEGSYSSASGIVKENDTVIFATTTFLESFPPQKLISSLISEKDLKEGESCMLIKMAIDKSFSEDEVVDFGFKSDSPSKSSGDSAFGKKISSLYNLGLLKVKSISEKVSKAKVRTPITKQGDIVNSITSSLTPNTGPSIKEKAAVSALKKMNFEKWMLIPIIAFILGASVFYSIYTRGSKKIEEINSPENQEVVENDTEDLPEIEPKEEVDPTALYDLKITDQSVEPNGIEVVGDKFYITTNSGKLLTSQIDSISFREIETQYPGIKNPTSMGSRILFTDNEGFKIMNAANNEIVSSHKISSPKLISTYNEAIYALEGANITKYTASDNTYTSAPWGTDPTFSNANAMGISFSVYLLTTSGDINTYTSGEETPFSTNIPGGLNNPVDLIASQPLTNIYIADKGNDRVVVMDKEGKFLKEVKPAKAGTWLDTKGIAVSPDEKKLYILSGTRLYEMDL